MRVIQVDAPPVGTRVHAPHEVVEAAKEAAEELAVGSIAADAEVVTDNIHNPVRHRGREANRRGIAAL